MLMALLYKDENTIAAAAPACDQLPYGDRYWLEFHEAEIEQRDLFETAYMTILNPGLQSDLRKLGIEESVCGHDLARRVVLDAMPEYVSREAA